MDSKPEAVPVKENTAGTDAEAKTRRRRSGAPVMHSRKVLFSFLCIAAAIIIFISVLAGHVRNCDTVFPNIYAADIDLEGTTPDEALSLLNRKYSPEKAAGLSIPLTCMDTNGVLLTDDLDIQFLNSDTAAEAYNTGRNGNILMQTFAYIYHSLHKTVIEPAISYNANALADAVDSVAAPHETEPVGYTFKIEPSQVTIYTKVKGIKADRKLIASAVESQIRNMHFEDISIVPETVDPEPLNLDEFYNWLTSDAENAYYEKDADGNVTVHAEKLKCTVEKSAVEQAISNADSSAEGFCTFAVQTEEPEIMSAELQKILYSDLLGSYKTGLSGSAARVNNVSLATSRINGYELLPGEEISYDKTILPRNYANGYQAAPVYVGNKVESGMGGGICQPSSTLYCAALYANLEITERHNHSMAVGYVPAGMDATIAEGVLDLRIKNSTGYPVKIVSSVSGGTVNFSIYGYNPDNISVEILRSSSGDTYYVTRVVKENGTEVKREQMFSSRYVPHAEEEPSATPKPSETAKPTDSSESKTPSTDSKSTESTGTAETENAPAAAPAPSSAPVPAVSADTQSGSGLTE